MLSDQPANVQMAGVFNAALPLILANYNPGQVDLEALQPIDPDVSVFVTRGGARQDGGRNYNYQDNLIVQHGRLLLLWSGQHCGRRDPYVKP
jgi:hypothetical protein